MVEKEKGRDENWEERERMVELLKADPILKPYFEGGTFKVTNGHEKAIPRVRYESGRRSPGSLMKK